MLTFLTIDPYLGKVNKESLPQQTLMELLIEKFTENKGKICDLGELKEISDWHKVQFNETNEVVHINWYDLGIGGSLDLQWLPLTTEDARFAWNNLKGTVDLTCLPDALEILSLSKNKFHGTVDLTRLPPQMKDLRLFYNDFSGVTDFSQLPRSMTILYVSNTNLQGEISEFDGKVVSYNSQVKDTRL